MDVEVLINKENRLDENYIPDDLVITDNNENNFHNFIDPNHKPMISNKVYPYFLKMKEDALKEGYNIILDSGYRSYEYQKNIWDDYVKKYGFILRYPKGKENITGYGYEPWHYRFVGIKLAKELYSKDITLEEYYLMVKA